MMSKTVAKYLAEGMNKACKNHAIDEIRDLYSVGIVPTQHDVCTALLISDDVNELIGRYNCSVRECFGFIDNYFGTLVCLEDCGIDFSDYVSYLFREVFPATGIYRSILCEIALIYLKPEKLELLSNRSWIVREYGASLFRSTSFFECAWIYTGGGKNSLNYHMFHLLTHSYARKMIMLDIKGVDTVLCNMICGDTQRGIVPVIDFLNSIVKTFIDSIDDDYLLCRFPSKRLLPGFLQQLRRCVYTVETTFVIDVLIEAIL